MSFNQSFNDAIEVNLHSGARGDIFSLMELAEWIQVWVQELIQQQQLQHPSSRDFPDFLPPSQIKNDESFFHSLSYFLFFFSIRDLLSQFARLNDSRRLLFSDGSLILSISQSSIFHLIENWRKLFENIIRVLIPNPVYLFYTTTKSNAIFKFSRTFSKKKYLINLCLRSSCNTELVWTSARRDETKQDNTRRNEIAKELI